MVKTVIHNVFEHVASRHGGCPAVRDLSGEISYEALNAAANQVAFNLRARYSVGRGDVVGLYLPAGIRYVTGLLGAAKAGCIFLPLDPNTPFKRQQQLLAKVPPAVVLTDADHHGSWVELHADVPLLYVNALSTGTGANTEVEVTGEDGSYVMFTSGSTGEPKAILGSQKGLSHFIHWEVNEFGLDATTRVSLLAPTTFDVSLRDIFAPLLAGGTVCIPSPEIRNSHRLLVDWLNSEGISLIHCVPSIFRGLLQELEIRPRPHGLFTRLRHVLLAGEPLYGVDVRRWRALMGESSELVNLYGPSETTLAKAFYRIHDAAPDPGRMVPVGNPLPNTALLIIKDGELCDPGEIGEVYIKTPFMSKGYYLSPGLTDEVFVQNPLTPGTRDVVYRTGDLGRYGAGGIVELLGRKDTQTKVKGIRVELSEIELVLLRHPSIEQAVVAAHQSGDHEVHLTAYFIASETLSNAGLRDHLNQWLPQAIHPAFFLQMRSFPLNLHGKVNRRALPRPADLLYQEHPYVPPASSTEEGLAALFADVLDVEKISVTHSLVELGGDSLKAIRLVTRIFQRFGVELKLQQLFPGGTVRRTAAIVDGCLQAGEALSSGMNPGIEQATPDELQWLAEQEVK